MAKDKVTTRPIVLKGKPIRTRTRSTRTTTNTEKAPISRTTKVFQGDVQTTTKSIKKKVSNTRKPIEAVQLPSGNADSSSNLKTKPAIHDELMIKSGLTESNLVREGMSDTSRSVNPVAVIDIRPVSSPNVKLPTLSEVQGRMNGITLDQVRRGGYVDISRALANHARKPTDRKVSIVFIGTQEGLLCSRLFNRVLHQSVLDKAGFKSMDVTTDVCLVLHGETISAASIPISVLKDHCGISKNEPGSSNQGPSSRMTIEPQEIDWQYGGGSFSSTQEEMSSAYHERFDFTKDLNIDYTSVMSSEMLVGIAHKDHRMMVPLTTLRLLNYFMRISRQPLSAPSGYDEISVLLDALNTNANALSRFVEGLDYNGVYYMYTDRLSLLKPYVPDEHNQ